VPQFQNIYAIQETRETDRGSHHGHHSGPPIVTVVWHPLPLRRCGWIFAVSWLPWLPLWYLVLQFVSKFVAGTGFKEPPLSRLSLSHTTSLASTSFTATLREISANKSVGNFPLLPYSSMVANSFTWGTYGILKGEPSLWSSNAIGLVLGAWYCIEFIRHSPEDSKTLPGTKHQHIQAVAAVIMVTTTVAMSPVYMLHQTPETWIGRAGIVFYLIMYASPLSALGTVLRQRSAKVIPLPVVVSSVVSCSLWSVTGLFKMKDGIVAVPSLLGLSFALAQVALKLIFGNGSSHIKNDSQSESVVNLPMERV